MPQSYYKTLSYLYCALASCGAVYCNWPCLYVCLWVCYHDNSKLHASILTKLGLYVGKGSDHLQLITFWLSCTPGKGVCGGAKIFGSALLQPARSVCVSLSVFSLPKYKSWRKQQCAVTVLQKYEGYGLYRVWLFCLKKIHYEY